MKRVKLDRIDLRILRELQKDGRMTNVDLAAKVGISAPPCLRRVRALEESGFIVGYHADVAADKLGYGITVFTMVSLINHSESDLMDFARLANGWPMVRECYMMTGDADFIIRIVAENWESFQNFLTHQLAGAPNVAHYKSAPAMQRTKYEPGIPIDEKSAPAPTKPE
jgi:hypothetical protein